MQQRINLVPQPALATRIKKTVPYVVGGLVVVCCLIVLFMGLQVKNENQRLSASIAQLEQRQHALQMQQAKIAQINRKVKKMEEEEKRLRKLVSHLSQISSKKQRFSELLLGIAKVLPATVRCEKIILKERSGEIVGQATEYRDLPDFVKRLNSLPRFHSGSLHVLSQSDNEEMKLLTFTIVFQLQRQL